MRKPVAVVAVRRRITSLNDGANTYLSVMLDQLRDAGFSISLVYAPESSFGDSPVGLTAADLKQSCDRIIWRRALHVGRWSISLSPQVYGRFLRRIARELSARLSRREAPAIPGRSSQRLPSSEAKELAAAIDAENPRLALVEYSALGEVLRHVETPGATRAVLLHDLFSSRTSAMRAHARPLDVAAMTIEEEAAQCEAADLLVYASRTEKTELQAILPNKTHRWLAPARPLRDAAGTVEGQAKALFIGVRHGGNLDALELLMETIWPRVIQKAPTAALDIVGEIGAAMKPEWRRLPGVSVHGVVEDLRGFAGPDVVGLAPNRVASGISIKIADYISLGMPVVAFPAALTGYGDRLDGAVDLASSEHDFASRLVELMEHPEQRRTLAKRGRSAVLSESDNDALRSTLATLASSSP